MRLGTAALALVAASSSTPAPSPSGCVDDASWAWTYGLDIKLPVGEIPKVGDSIVNAGLVPHAMFMSFGSTS